MGRRPVGAAARSGRPPGVGAVRAGRDAGLRGTARRGAGDSAVAQERRGPIRRDAATRLDRHRPGLEEGPATRAVLPPVAAAHEAGGYLPVEDLARHPDDATAHRHRRPPRPRHQRARLDARERPEERDDRVRQLAGRPVAGGAGHAPGVPHAAVGGSLLQRAGRRNARPQGRAARPEPEGPAGSHRPTRLSGPQGRRGRDPGARQGRPGPRAEAARRRRRESALRVGPHRHDAAGVRVARWATNCTTRTTPSAPCGSNCGSRRTSSGRKSSACGTTPGPGC